MDDILFRFAEEKDVPLILKFIKGLAEYEKLSDEVVATEDILREWIFEKKKAEVIFAMDGDKEAGFALFFHNISTWQGRAGLYLEDLFVLPECRGRGFGKGLLKKLASIAEERGCGRFEWICLDWNRPSIDFYMSLGAVPMKGQTLYREEGDDLRKLSGLKGDDVSDSVRFRTADENDAALILEFVKKLADHVGHSDDVSACENDIRKMVSEKKHAEVIFAVENGKEVGFAIFFNNFSTFLGRSGLYLEDIYILPDCRGRGIGRSMMRKLAQIADERGYGRVEWICLDSNRPAVDFYLSLYAEPVRGWTIYRETGDALKALSQRTGR